MVMGPTHAMSSAMLWLGAASLSGGAIATAVTGSPAVLAMSTLVAAGAALAPDIDSHSSTVVSSFGVAGKGAHSLVNGVSVSVYNATRTKYDPMKANGHRTLFHTSLVAVLAGLGVSALASIPKQVELFGKDFTVGQLSALVIMFLFTHLALGGLFEKQVRKTRKKYGVIGMMLTSAVITATVAMFLPEGQTLGWLGLSVGVGWFAHLLGDAITKMGVPLAFPFKIKGKRWWDVTLPSFLRIRAGGWFEYAVLLPFCTIATGALVIFNIPGMREAVGSFFS